MTWLWPLFVFLLPLAVVGESLLLRVREGKPVHYLATLAVTVGALAVAGFAAYHAHLAPMLPRLPFEVAPELCGLDVAALVLPGLVLVVAAARRAQRFRERAAASGQVWLAVALATATCAATGLVSTAPHDAQRMMWPYAIVAGIVLAAWLGVDRYARTWAARDALPEARVGAATRGAPAAAFVPVVAAATVAVFAGLRIAPDALGHLGVFDPAFAIADEQAFATRGDTVAYVEDSGDLVLRKRSATARVALRPSGCWWSDQLSYPTLYVFPDETHVLLLAGGTAACIASFEDPPRVRSLRDVLAHEHLLVDSANTRITIAGAAPSRTVVYAESRAVALDLEADRIETFADHRDHPMSVNCELGATTREVRIACLEMGNPFATAAGDTESGRDRLVLYRYDAAAWPPSLIATSLLEYKVPPLDSIRFSPDARLLAHWHPFRNTPGYGCATCAEVFDVERGTRTTIPVPGTGDIAHVAFDAGSVLVVEDVTPDPGDITAPARLDVFTPAGTPDGASRRIPFGGRPFVAAGRLWVVAPFRNVYDLPWR